MSPEKAVHAGRTLENAGFVLGLVVGGLQAFAEVTIYFLVSIGSVVRTDAPFPWFVAMFFIGCILPKYLGRATAGQVWIVLAQAVARMLPGKGKRPSVAIEAECKKCGNAMTACVCPE